jgi:2'-5' RNA ligase
VSEPGVGRAFLAVVPPDATLDAVERLSRRLELPDSVRPVPRAKWHLTVRFLGNRVDFTEVEARLAPLSVEPGTVRLAGGGAFPNPRRAEVLWLGVDRGSELLARLAGAVHGLVDPASGAPRFHPHLTLARCRRRTDLRATVDAIGDEPLGAAWTVDELVLFQSRLGRGPAVYEPRARIRLRGAR